MIMIVDSNWIRLVATSSLHHWLQLLSEGVKPLTSSASGQEDELHNCGWK
jgi:hypothetical protein